MVLGVLSDRNGVGMKNKVIKVVAGFLCASVVLASGFFGNINVVSAADIPINSSYFPDEYFREYITKNFDKDKNGSLSSTEISKATRIDMEDNSGCSSLKGIEYFTSLKYLLCWSYNLTSIDVSKNLTLETLDLYGCPISSIDLSKNTNLTGISISTTNIRSFDFSKNINLKYLDVTNNKLPTLDVSKNTNLVFLYCGMNNLTYLDISNNTKLSRLICFDCFITSIGIKNNNVLIDAYNNPTGVFDADAVYTVLNEEEYADYTKMYFSNKCTDYNRNKGLLLDNYCDIYVDKAVSKTTPTPTLRIPVTEEYFPDSSMRLFIKYRASVYYKDELSYSEIYRIKEMNLLGGFTDLKGIEYFTELEILNVGNDHTIKEIDLSNNHKIVELNGNLNNLTKLNLNGCSKLTEIDVWGGHCLEEIDLTGCSSLNTLCVASNNLTELDISDCVNLTSLQCNGNSLTSLDVSNCTKLERLGLDGNSVTSIDVSNCKDLIMFDCSNNQINNLDVSNNRKLESLDFGSNNIKEIDLSNNPNLTSIWCASNPLISIDITNNPLLERISLQKTEIKKLNLYYNEVLIDVWENGSFYDKYISGDARRTIYRYKENGGYLREDYIDYDLGLEVVMEPTPVPTATPTVAPTTSPTTSPTATPTSVPTTGTIPTAIPTSVPKLSVGDFVSRCYTVALGREAEAAGYKYWCDALNNGEACGAQVGYGFIFSTEYISKNRTDEEFVKDLYKMYFDRTPDEGGFNYWVDMLKTGTSREVVFAGFANSLEFYNLCTDYSVVQGLYLVGVNNQQQGGVNCFVARLYKVCLNRLPDMGGQSGWVLKLMNGEVTGSTCAYGFVFSPEFIGKEPSNEEFVAYMYRAFFGREADEGGFNSWVQKLNSGATYEDVFMGFSGSLEFASLCASYGINAN